MNSPQPDRADRAAGIDRADSSAAGAAECPRPRPWLAMVGVGEDGVDGLAPAARDWISSAELVFGSRRHLALVASLIRGKATAWPRPFDSELREVLAERGRPVCVLASGDPFQFGVGALLAARVPAGEWIAIPGVSAFSLAASRLGWSLPDTECVSLHARPLDAVRSALQPGARVLALTSDGDAPRALAALLTELGFGASRIHVLERLGGPGERIRSASAAAFELGAIDALNTVAIECSAAPDARILARAPGRPEELFEHDGQITRRDVRALVLARLAPRRGELLWDVGAGAGSVAIEWLLCDRSLSAIAIEADAARSERIHRNAVRFGVPGLEVVVGRAPHALVGLPAPHAVFVGGGGRDTAVLDACQAALRSRGRLVANAVTLETEAVLLARHAQDGGELVRIALAAAAPLGGQWSFEPARPLLQWTWHKP